MIFCIFFYFFPKNAKMWKNNFWNSRFLCIWDTVLGVLGPPEHFYAQKSIASYCAIIVKIAKMTIFLPQNKKRRPDLDSGGQVCMENTLLVPEGWWSRSEVKSTPCGLWKFLKLKLCHTGISTQRNNFFREERFGYEFCQSVICRAENPNLIDSIRNWIDSIQFRLLLPTW